MKIVRGNKEFRCITANAVMKMDDGTDVKGHIVFLPAEDEDKVLDFDGVDAQGKEKFKERKEKHG